MTGSMKMTVGMDTEGISWSNVNDIRSKPRLRYVLLVSQFGAEIEASNLSKFVSSKGYEVHVITRSDRVTPWRGVIGGADVHQVLYCPRPVFLRFTAYILSFLETVRVKPDLIYGVGMFPEGLIASISAKLLHRPLIIMTMGSDVRLPNSFVVNLFWKFILRSVRTVIVKEKESANRLTRYANQVEIVILPNGVDQSRFMLNRRECRKSIGLRRGEKMILYVGRLHPVKNVGALIAAFARVHRHFHDVKLFIVGAGPELSNLIKLAGNKHISGSIIFVGRVSPNDVPRFMVAADVFVLPSISEGSPSVVLEALAAGVPVLASNVGGVPDLVRNGQEGFLFEPGDLGQMTDLLSLVLRSHPLRKKMSKNARDRASHFPLTRTHEKILKISLDAMRTF